MQNELLLLLNMIVIYGGVLAFYRFWGKEGLFCWVAIPAILANIEVMLLIEAFTLEQTLGNILFASSFIATDILSENEGKAVAQKAVNLGIAVSALFIIITQMWLWFIPGPNDWAMGSFREIFSNTPRIAFSGLLVYAIVQKFDVWIYHKIWAWSNNRVNNKRKFLWLRNNLSTLTSQFLNAVLFNVFAFAGIYKIEVLINICISTYVIYIATSLLDTPIVYAARRIKENNPKV